MVVLSMLYTIPFFRCLCIIEAVYRSYQITGDSPDLFKFIFFFALISAAFRADMSFNNTAVSAAGIAIDRMIDASITNTCILHTAHDRFKCLQIIGRITIHFHIGNMPAIRKFMVRSFLLNFFECCYMIIYRNMERVCIIISICNARNNSVNLFINTRKSSGQTFCRSGDQRKVQTVFFCCFIANLTHMPDDFQAELLSSFTFSVMLTDRS